MNIVRKVINILLGIVLISGVLNAAPVSQEEAEQLVRGYMSYSSNTLLDGMVGNTIEKVDEIKVSHNNQEIVLAYVFNFSPKGWVVVTADDRMSPILGFSADDVAGDAFTNDASPVKGIMVAQLLSDYIQLEDAETPQPMAVGDGEAVVEENIIKQKINKNKSRRAKYSKYASKDDAPAPMASPLSSVSDLRVGKLLETKWTQSTTYGENYYTPKNYADGCMQTAIGQIFYYHQWPQVGIGVVRNTDGYLYDASGNRIVDRVTGQYAVTKGNTVDGVTTELSTRGGDGVGGPYKWNNMIKDSSTTPSEINKQARGALLYDIGVINGSEYSKNGTGANPSMAALMAVFDYASMRSTKIASWGTTNLVYGGEEAMLNSLNTNIDAGYPCAVTGWKVPSGSGHAVVFDGYGYQDDILYYHVNMGWGGSGDGFYHWSDFGNGRAMQVFFL